MRHLLPRGRPLLLVGTLLIGIVAWNFPYAIDDAVRREDEVQAFYDLTYAADGASPLVQDTAMARAAVAAKETEDIRGAVERFVERYGLEDARVLDVGSGTGYLQDVVGDYTGFDISTAAARHYHKPFVAGTATAMPFADGEFDAAWSIWVLEHIPNPEAALNEIRRVVKPGGLVYLRPAWNVWPWAAQGYEARSYGELGLWGRLVKTTIPVRRTWAAWYVRVVPSRTLRATAAWFGPTRLHFERLEPNFTEYWQADSDAVNRLDAVETAMWFESRGDRCVNCWTGARRLVQPDAPLVIRRGD